MICVQCQRGNHMEACIRWRGCDCPGALCGTPPPLALHLQNKHAEVVGEENE